MVIEYVFEVVGGPFDGTPGLEWRDDGKHPPPDLIFVGVCGKGRHCGTSKCRRDAKHVSYWLPVEEDRPPEAMPYPKQSEYVRTHPETGEMLGRAVYAIGGLSEPQNFGEAAREPVEVGGVRSDPLVTAFGDPDDELMSIIREAWAGEGRFAEPRPHWPPPANCRCTLIPIEEAEQRGLL